jgi:beta-glucanase (GH16 family)
MDQRNRARMITLHPTTRPNQRDSFRRLLAFMPRWNRRAGWLIATLALAVLAGSLAAPGAQAQLPQPVPALAHAAGASAGLQRVYLPIVQHGSWLLIFQDEFAGDRLDHAKWVNCYLWANLGCYKTNGSEMEWYTPDAAAVSGGRLHLQAQQRPTLGSDGQTYPYTSGLIASGSGSYDPADGPRFAFRYGYVEIRARVPAGRGFWSAFWLLRADRSLPWEIDIFEILGHQPATANMTVHYPLADGSTGAHGTAYTGPDFSAGEHTYALDWSADQLVWYIDGVERKRERNAAHIPHDPMYLIANLAVGGDWPGPPDPTTVFPNMLNIDYIRVWQRSG